MASLAAVRWRSWVRPTVALLATVALAAPARAGVPVIQEFPVPTANSLPAGIALGPDGNLWFAERNAAKIGRLTPAGVFTEFPVPLLFESPLSLTSGPDGALWFTATISTVPYLSRITTAGTFGNTFPLESDSPVPEAITLGPDGHLWFTTLDRIGKADASGNVVEFPLDGNYGAFGIAASNAVGEPVWFTEQTANRIGLITTDGEVTEFGGLLIPA